MTPEPKGVFGGPGVARCLVGKHWQPYPNHAQVRALTERIGELQDLIMEQVGLSGDEAELRHLRAEKDAVREQLR
jgi:hypothetical protein